MRNLSAVATLLLGSSINLFAVCGDLFISEYIEGSSYNKAIELYNPGTTPIDLSLYTLELYSNGNAQPNASLQLSGSVSTQDVFVLAHTQADTSILAQADLQNASVINFNGDDALVLKKNGEIIDSIGQIGVDPGSAWSANGVSTKDQTLVRKTDETCDNPSALDTFDPSLQWDGFSKDTFSYLGKYKAAEEETPIFSYIHDIQGNALTSTMLGKQVIIEGIVVGSYLKSGFNGFFLQEEDRDADSDINTSEGIFVYCPSCSEEVHLGDLVQVNGEVSEYKGLTQIRTSSLSISGINMDLPLATSLQLPVKNALDYEKFEGMLVSLNAGKQPLVVNENYNLGRYGSFTLASERMLQFTQTNKADSEAYALHQLDLNNKSMIIDDGSSFQNPRFIPFPKGGLSYENTLRSGYTLHSITGVFDERFGSYRIQANTQTSAEFNSKTNPRIYLEEKIKKELRIASYNVLNYFNTFEACTYGVNGEIANCRGAENIEEFQRQRLKIVSALLEIDADIYGLMEIENDGYDDSSALADLVDALNKAAGKKVYAFINVDKKTETLNALGTDAIKVALIYNEKRVKPVGKTHALKLDDNDKNRPSLLQVFKKKRSNKRVLVSVNHFKSKGSSCKELFYNNVADINQNNGQGNCNLTRTQAANILTDYIDTDQRLRRNKNIILLGDFNSYAKEDPMKHIEDRGYVNILADKRGLDDYSYIFKAEAGTLDYAMTSKHLSSKVKSVLAWHSNTDEPRILDYNLNYKSPEQYNTLYRPDAYRASDHDPIIIDIEL